MDKGRLYAVLEKPGTQGKMKVWQAEVLEDQGSQKGLRISYGAKGNSRLRTHWIPAHKCSGDNPEWEAKARTEKKLGEGYVHAQPEPFEGQAEKPSQGSNPKTPKPKPATGTGGDPWFW